MVYQSNANTLKVLPGTSFPRGATLRGRGVNFSLFSENATSVEVCLFNSPEETEPFAVLPLREKTALTWHGFVPGLRQ